MTIVVVQFIAANSLLSAKGRFVIMKIIRRLTWVTVGFTCQYGFCVTRQNAGRVRSSGTLTATWP